MSDGTLLVWVTDSTQWWSDGARDALTAAGHRVRVFGSVDQILDVCAAQSGPPPDVVVFGCCSTSVVAISTLRRLISCEWPVVVSPGEADVSIICDLFMAGATNVAKRYGGPAALVKAVESANEFAHKERIRHSLWGAPS